MSSEQIWAPWRLAYIQTADAPHTETAELPYLPGADRTCFVCQSVADSADRPRHVIWRGPETIALLNLFPYNNGHLLVAPKCHQGRLDEVPEAVQCELTRTITRLVACLEKTLHPQGFNIGLNLGRVAGAGLPGHLHWHIVPRWNGDTNFMPVLANVHVIPQSLDALWEVLTAALAE